MASNNQPPQSSNGDDIPLRPLHYVSYEEDEYGYVDARENRISSELVRQLPSRHIDLLSNSSVFDEISDPNLRRRQSQYRTLQLKNAALTSHQVSADVEKIYEHLNSDPDATVENKLKILREMHQSLTIKRQVKERLDADLKKRRADEVLDRITRLKLRTHSVWHKFLYELKNATYAIELWHSAIKSVQGQFGSGVASYFIFLRFLVYLNFSNLVLTGAFLFIPQLIYDMSSENPSNKTTETFSGYDLLTGSGALTDTSLYFGHYTHEIINTGVNYNMPLAYLFIIGIICFINLCAVSYSLTSSYQKNYVDTAGDVKHLFCNKVFSAWDYSIETEDAAKLRKIAFCNEIKEMLFFIRRDQREKTLSQKIIQFALMALVNLCCLGITVAVCYLIYYLLEKKALKVQVRILEDMTLALLVTFVSSTFYFLLKYCTKLEFYYTRKRRLYFTMIRAVILRTAMIAIIVYFWAISNVHNESNRPCYETELGKEIYRLVWVNFFVAVIFFTIFGEFFRRLISSCFFSNLKLAQFDIGFNTLDLIYYQTLIWMGTFCMPLAPLINIIILVLLFYVKKYSVSSNCRPPRRTWSVNEAQTFFLTLLFFKFVLTAFSVGYVLFAIDPSPCGPFKNYASTSDIIRDLFFEKGKEFEASEIVKYLTSPGVLFALFCALCVVMYYVRAQANAHISVVKIIREQLIMEGKDRVFLLKLYDKALAMHSQKNEVNGKNSDPSPRDLTPLPKQSDSQDVLINEGYNEYYNTPGNQPLPKNLEPGYIPANVPVNKPMSPSIKSILNSSKTSEFKLRSPINSIGENDSPVRKATGIHIPSHQPGFRHFFHEDSPKIIRDAKDLHDKYL